MEIPNEASNLLSVNRPAPQKPRSRAWYLLVVVGAFLLVAICSLVYAVVARGKSSPTGGLDCGNPSAIWAALNQGDIKALQALIDRGMNVNGIRDALGLSALAVAAAAGNTPMVGALLDAGADVFALDSAVGCSVLHKAVLSGSVDILQLLLRRNPAHLNLQCATTGNTALHDAVLHKQAGMVSALLSNGAMATIRNRAGWTPEQLIDEAWPKHPSPSPSPLPIKTEDDLLIIDAMRTAFADRNRALQQSIRFQTLMHAVANDSLSEVRRIISLGGQDANQVYPQTGEPNTGYTPLLLTAKVSEGRRPIDIFDLLVEYGADVHAQDYWMRYNLGHIAAANNHAHIIGKACSLKDNGFEIDSLSAYNGFSPLHQAVWHGSFESAKALIDCGADYALRNHANQTALQLARQFNYTDISSYIESVRAQRGDTREPPASDGCLMRSSSWSPEAGVDAGADDVVPPPPATCALMRAVQRNDLPAVQQLLRDGSDANNHDLVTGLTPLHAAAGAGSSMMVELLLNAGADVFAVDAKMGTSALHKAAMAGHVHIAKQLLSRGAFVDIQTPRNGHTPLHDAVWFKRPAMVEFLLNEAQANPLVPNHIQGALPVDLVESAPRSQVDVDIRAAILDSFAQRAQADALWLKDSERVFNAQTAAQVRSLLSSPRARSLVNDASPLDNRSPTQGMSALQAAAWNGQADIVSELVHDNSGHSFTWASFVDAKAADRVNKLAAGHLAAASGSAEVLSVLIKTQGFELNAQSMHNGYSLLHTAVLHHNTAAALVLIRAGADKTLKNHAGETAEDMALAWSYMDIILLLTQPPK